MPPIIDRYLYCQNFNRIFKKVMYNRFKDFIEKYDMLNLSQYGFRKAHATHHTIIDIVEAIQTNMDQRLFTCGIFVDLKKAFDTVNHKYFLINFIIMAVEEKLTTGFHPTYQMVYKQSKLAS